MIEKEAVKKRLLEYILSNDTYVGFQISDIKPGENVEPGKILRLTNPGRIYKSTLAPEDRFDYANLNPELTEPLKDFPTTVRIK